MELVGKIIKILPLQEGQGANGPWKKQDFIIETEEQYPKKVCFNAWGDKITQFNLQEGQSYKVSINIESREYNERWYTDVRAWKVEPAGAVAAPPANTVAPVQDTAPQTNATASTEDDIFEGGGDDDLPF